MERLPKNDEYFFVNLAYGKVTRTIDLYLYTDNCRFRDGNYFPQLAAAQRAYKGYIRKFDARLKGLDAEIQACKNKKDKDILVGMRRSVLKEVAIYIKKQPKTI